MHTQATTRHSTVRFSRRTGIIRMAQNMRNSQQQSQKDPSAVLLEAVASVAMKARLKRHAEVIADVQCTTWGLLQGRLDAASLGGTDWQSPLDLTARVLQVHLGEAQLDMSQLVQKQTIALLNKPVGSAYVHFNAADFGSFLVHVLMRNASVAAVQGQEFVFDKQNVVVSANSSSSSSPSQTSSASYQASAVSATPSPTSGVAFQGTWLGDGHRYRLVMEPDYSPTQGSSIGSGNSNGSSSRGAQGNSRSTSYQTRSNGSMQAPPHQRNQKPSRPAAMRVRVTAQPLPRLNTATQVQATLRGRADVGPSPALVASELTAFFNGLTLDLQGAEMKFESMSVQQSSRTSGGDFLVLNLAITLHRFPPPNLGF